MVCLGKVHLVALGLEVGRVAVDPCVLPVILADELLEVLVLDDYIPQPAGALPNEVKEAPDVAGLSTEGLGAAAEAVADQFEIVRRSSIRVRMDSAAGGSRRISVRSISSRR